MCILWKRKNVKPDHLLLKIQLHLAAQGMGMVETRQTTSGLLGKVADIQVCGSSVLQCRELTGG